MQFTKAEEYGMFGVLYLAGKPGNDVTPLSEISDSQHIPEKFLAKIFQSLSKAGIIRSHRGVRGGFTLARSANEITVKDVLETIQGPYHLMKCLHDPNACAEQMSDKCALREVVLLAEKKLVEVFETYTIADLASWQHKNAVTEAETAH